MKKMCLLASICFFALQYVYPQNVTYRQNGVTVAGGNGSGSAANQLKIPGNMVIDGSGNIFIADEGNYRVQKWAPGATVGVTVAGGNGFGTAANQLNFPAGIFLDAANNLYIADYSAYRVQRWSPGATSGVTIAGGNGQGFAPNQFYNPLNTFFEPDGTMYVSDVFNHRVQRFDVIRFCPPNTVINVPSCNATATISWTEFRDSFPDTLRIPQYLDSTMNILTLMGTQSGHGYYSSAGSYLWPVAQSISEFIGDTGVNGHLVTITSAAESNFLYNLTNGTTLTPWIGLISTGQPGKFRWITGEPFDYTRWAQGEPNNYLGNAANVAEPFGHMYSVGIWNDQRSTSLRFITEFEKPLIYYRQVSGPANGSQQPPGVYNICYEKTNGVTGEKNMCCFSITVACPATLTNEPTGLLRTDAYDATATGLKATAFPNPSNNQFSLNITSANQEKITLQVTDITGKLVETRSGLAPNQTVRIGSNLKAGVYFVELRQGTKKVQLKMVKQSR